MRNLLASLVVLSLAATGAAADDDPDTEVARGHFEKGAAFYEGHDYVHALGEFEAARRAHPAPAFDFNIGRCLDRLERWSDAADAYRRYVDWKPAPSDAAEVRDRIRALEARLAEAKPKSGTLTIISHVAGAAISIDANPVATAQLGAPISLSEGVHNLVARKEGYLARTLAVKVEPGKSITVELDPLVISVAAAAPPPRKKSLWWVGVLAGGVAVAGVATVLGIVLAPAPAAMPYAGNLTPGLQKIMP